MGRHGIPVLRWKLFSMTERDAGGKRDDRAGFPQPLPRWSRYWIAVSRSEYPVTTSERDTGPGFQIDL